MASLQAGVTLVSVPLFVLENLYGVVRLIRLDVDPLKARRCSSVISARDAFVAKLDAGIKRDDTIDEVPTGGATLVMKSLYIDR